MDTTEGRASSAMSDTSSPPFRAASVRSRAAAEAERYVWGAESAPPSASTPETPEKAQAAAPPRIAPLRQRDASRRTSRRMCRLMGAAEGHGLDGDTA